MMTKEQEYREGFEKEEFEIIVYITTGWGGGGYYGDLVEVTSYFPAMVDLRSGECIVADGRVETPIGREEYKNDQYYHFADNGIYRLLVSKCVQRELGPNMLASMNNRYLLKKVIAENAPCPELEAIRAEYTRPIVIEVCGAEFLLNRRYGWYEGTVDILCGSCKVSLYLDSNSKMKAKRSSARFEALMQNPEELDGKIKEHCVGRMLEAANEWKENEDDPDITADQFKENMGAPIELVVQSSGELEIYYGDGDMFGGHAIFVNVNTRNEIVRCELAG